MNELSNNCDILEDVNMTEDVIYLKEITSLRDKDEHSSWMFCAELHIHCRA